MGSPSADQVIVPVRPSTVIAVIAADHLLVEVRVAGLCAALLKGSLDGVDGVIAVRRDWSGVAL